MTRNKMPTGPIKGQGVAAISFRGDRYCVDCAKSVLNGETFGVQLGTGDGETIENADGETVVARLITGDIHTLDCGGVDLRNSLDGVDREHCGRGGRCVHAIPGEETPIHHDEDVGVVLDL